MKPTKQTPKTSSPAKTFQPSKMRLTAPSVFQTGTSCCPPSPTAQTNTSCCTSPNIESSSCCCSPSATAPTVITQVSTSLYWSDILGGWKVRWGINRTNYKIQPGIYAVGKPDKKSAVLVSANYKLSFDILRKELKGLNIWIMVIDTKGINVWCAAGKGTFGTTEIVHRINLVQLTQLVDHRTIILPQLGAPGVVAHEVLKLTGFRVVYGPIRAQDIPAFLEAGQKATPAMRKVNFPFLDRLVLTPVELVGSWKILKYILAILFVLNTIKPGPLYSADIFLNTLRDFLPYFGATLLGCVLVPALLPWIPGKAFFWKGWIMGLGWALLVNSLNSSFGWSDTTILQLANYITLPVLSAYLALNFTGCSTYTSLSGVKKEMDFAIPVVFLTVLAGSGLILFNTVNSMFRGN